ncbi:MAG: chemotaxis protein CheW [Candidatus Cloacimonetes bacterium]|nr:chemotaxis protein CheW [Candidatus Cloacimonadota bacterium]
MKKEQKLNATQIQGKYLTFNLMNEYYGVNVKSILQIVGILDTSITSVPNSPQYVKGVINLRGKLIPIIDLRKKFNLPEQEYTDKTSIIINRLVTDKAELFIGVIVDRVIEVLDIHAPEIEETPAFGVDFDVDFILGMGKVKNKVVTLIDIEEVLTNASINATLPPVAQHHENIACPA